ncbi:DegV family EDD domain-containing protein [Erysipelothrix sp. HDW6C]|uniref:DegV family protein n=1 Tax=Erysipelothrix sp. HDW6C TaxID=2714930 RepID=UPI00140AA61F|nr:DegV family protein [Erysipelothrix sp. HDW6C]QIK68777.1 DegV family EDD domain-containing protein [Erysipelothrix sp. HDW6C]
MTDLQFDGKHLLRSIKEGGNRIIAARSNLNAINVFPVADRDTGNNLASLMRSILEIPEESIDSIKDTLFHVANKAIEGAKGNSGMIFAQYFNGVSRSYRKEDNDVHHLSESLVFAVEEAYQSVQDPQEGTILTIMKTWSRALQDSLQVHKLKESLVLAREIALQTLVATESQHSLMKRNRVVDAGAKGFYEFVDGFTDALIGEKQTKAKIAENISETIQIDQHTHEYDQAYRFCMEVTYRREGHSALKKEQLQKHGDSIVIAEGDAMTRVHLHTNTPQLVVKVLEPFGVAMKIKVDDMKQQYFDSHENDKKIALVTDSIADLPESILQRYNIHVLPLTILADEIEHLDKQTIDNETILNAIDKQEMTVTTSLPNQALVLRLFENLEAHYESVLFVSVASALSGTYNAVCNAAKAYQGTLTIAVIDSTLNSIAQGLLVESAGEYIHQGLALNEIVERLETEKQEIEIFVSVSDLLPMIQSGRIPQRLGKLFQKIGLKPLVSLDKEGKGTLTGVGMSAQSNQRSIKNKIKKRKKSIQSIVLGYTTDATTAHKWVDFFQELGISDVVAMPTSSIIALSAGRNATAVAVKFKGDKN